MDERRAFMRAICAEPADDSPRLVFADWLDEHGEHALAEFIRVGVALAATPEPRKLFVADGAGTMMDGLGVGLVHEGDGHYTASSLERGMSVETFTPGERVDIYAHVAGKSKPRWMRGMKYIRHVAGEREVIVFRKDDQSGRPWEGAKLQARAAELFKQHAASWVPVPYGHTLMVALMDATGSTLCANVSYACKRVKVSGDLRFYFSRGFASEWWGTLWDIERDVKTVFSQPVTTVNLTDRQASIYLRATDPVDAVCRWDVCEWSDHPRAGMLPGYIPREIWKSDRLSYQASTGRMPKDFATRPLANEQLSDAVVEWGHEKAHPFANL